MNFLQLGLKSIIFLNIVAFYFKEIGILKLQPAR